MRWIDEIEAIVGKPTQEEINELHDWLIRSRERRKIEAAMKQEACICKNAKDPLLQRNYLAIEKHCPMHGTGKDKGE